MSNKEEKNLMDLYLSYYPPTDDAVRDHDQEQHHRAGHSAISSHEKAPRKRPIERTVDLHGMTTLEAGRELDRFIATARNDGISKVLIIHGKGNHGTAGSVLRSFVRTYLEKNGDIGATGTPPSRDGGTGATWAMLRQRSR